MNERMCLELLRLIYDSAKKRVPIDLNYLNKLGEIAVPYEQLNDYVSGINLTDEDSTYNVDFKTININVDSCISRSIETQKDISTNPFENQLYAYDEVAIEFLHELRHAQESKTLDTEGQDIETKILDICMGYKPLRDKISRVVRNVDTYNAIFDIMAKSYEPIYDECWEYDPSERLAEEYAYKTNSRILKPIRKKAPTLYTFNELQIYFNYINGYDEGVIPTKFFIDQMKFGETYPEIEQISKSISFERRLSLGLEITEEELSFLAGKVDVLCRRLRR